MVCNAGTHSGTSIQANNSPNGTVADIGGVLFRRKNAQPDLAVMFAVAIFRASHKVAARRLLATA